MEAVEVVSIPFIQTLEHVCDKLKKPKPTYSNALEGGKFRVTVEIELGSIEEVQQFVKIQGSLSRRLACAKESAAEAAIHRIRAHHGFFIHDINFDANVGMREMLTQKDQQINVLTYQMELIQTVWAAMNNVHAQQLHQLQAEAADLKAQLGALQQGNAHSIETDPSKASY